MATTRCSKAECRHVIEFDVDRLPTDHIVRCSACGSLSRVNIPGKAVVAATITPAPAQPTVAPTQTAVSGWIVYRDNNKMVRVRRLGNGINDIGRQAQISLEVDDSEMSRKHFSLEITSIDGKASCLLKDLNSRNGTYLNSRKLTPIDRIFIESPQQILAGNTIVAIVPPGDIGTPEAAAKIGLPLLR